jgi:peptidoglycan hydrolase-like protein with peptidoglycan-binding domain
MADEKHRDAWERADAVASIASKLLIPVILVVATSLLSRDIQQRQAAVSEGGLNRQWVELALSVLQNEAMDDQSELRDWSVEVINHYMPEQIQLPAGLRDGLVDGTIRLPASTPWSISGQEVRRIQVALNALGVCGRVFADGFAGPQTRRCLAAFLGDATDREVQGLINIEPELLAGWVEDGSPPADWRAQAGAALLADPTVEVLGERSRAAVSPVSSEEAPASGGSPAAAATAREAGAGAVAAGQPVARVQAAMATRGLCPANPDGVAGPLTVACVASYLGDADAPEARGLLVAAPELLLAWIESGAAPANWRELAAEEPRQ